MGRLELRDGFILLAGVLIQFSEQRMRNFILRI